MSAEIQTVAERVSKETSAPLLKPIGFRLKHLRWLMIGLIFLATLINYIDRLTISVLAPVIRESLQLSSLQYASLGTWFLSAYTVSQLLSGKLYDRIGTRRGFTCSVVVWSIASLLHATARGLSSMSIFRFLLGLGEAGNWPGAAKVVAEWFPIRERAFGLAIFNSGAALGSVFEQHNTLLVDNHGQGNEGDGHDAWRGFPYGQLNKIHIVDFRPAKDSVSFVGDAASAYAADFGLTSFQRSLTFTTKTGLNVIDEITSSTPHIFTSLLHADNTITASGSSFGIDVNGVSLLGNVISPSGAKLVVEPNWMTAPGRPGSVASGKREARGERLRILTIEPAKNVHFSFEMKIETAKSSNQTAKQ
jgi:MFS family permease